uniref:Taste receptor type 2 n=1 Tax=Sphaeramia orbicularis TaxID=375764 RepID=A0A673B826_9TELE
MLSKDFSTASYLHKHMKSVAHSGSSFSGVNLQSQMRVTVTGICQAVLYLAYGVFYLFTSISDICGKLNISSMVSFTVTSLYISGTTVTLGVEWMFNRVLMVMTCYVWLNFYYYIQIVPCAPLMWVKKNIKTVIYMFLALDVTLFSLYGTVNVFRHISMDTFDSHGNQTMTIYPIHYTKVAFYLITRVYILFCLCISVLSSFSTIRYLHKHMRSVAQSGSAFSAARLQSQMRVTITGICQGVLYLFFSIYYFMDSVSLFYGEFSFCSETTFTVTSLYISGTTVTLGVGQAVFRERITSVWKALKALRANCSAIKLREYFD